MEVPRTSKSGQLMKEVTGEETREHIVLEISSGAETRPLQLVLSFSNLAYSVKTSRKMTIPRLFRSRVAADGRENLSTKTRVLLSGISGEAREGEILAVLGASGSGKSTLIDALANRIAKGSLKGTVTLNGENLKSRLLKVISAYVMQDDLLFPMLTVEETLMFAAEFRLPSHRGVSGGERRRVSIGIDIIHDPIILFLDEPTSGLDSTSAFMVVNVLQRIAQSGSIVIMSIHQPSYRILGLLDRLIFLSRGQTIFSGSPTSLASFFESFGHLIPENENRTEFALDLIRELEESSEGTESLVEFNKSWQSKQIQNDSTTYGLSLKEAISASISRGKLVSGAAHGQNSLVQTFANSFWIEMVVLSNRTITNSRRMPELFRVRLGSAIVTGFILATLFWRLDNTSKGVQERLGFFAVAIATTFFNSASTLPMFLQERYIFMRETAYNAYRRSSYVISHSLTALPALIFLSLAFSVITFFRYPYEAVLQNEFDDATKCFVQGFQMFDNTPFGDAPDALKIKLLSSLGMNISSKMCVTTGPDVLQHQGITAMSKWNCLWVTIAWGFFFNILFYVALLIGSKNKRR
ncbi:hypothetical protein Acr_24g0010320 [Actinidia rufa]|uniref:ABC transporter domain-containing protein n=1 Tax=Actinidia rufa TaxID=165716 RepID=A0A7J0GVN1_9ERIC|nr:hypothetical protein Acr_24g0010320 [Actinidia rufa]